MSIKPTYEELEQRVIDKMNYNRETIAGHGDKSQATPRLIYMLIGVAGLIVICMLGYGFHLGDRMNTMYRPLIDCAMEIKLEATTAHLWFEEIISGDRYEDMATVWKHLDQADWYAKAMLEGGKNPEGIFIPLDNNKMRPVIIEVQGKLSEFRDITKQRIAAIETSGVGTAVEQRYDAIFNDFIIQADEVESRLQQVMARDIGCFRYTQVTLMVVCLLLFLSIGIVVHRFERIRANDFWVIKEANKNLETEIVTRKQAEEALLKSRKELRNLASQLIEAQERERKRISLELHDEMGQALTAVNIGLKEIEEALPSELHPTIGEKLTDVHSLIEQALEQVSELSLYLRPAMLDDLGLVPTLRWHLNKVGERTNMEIDFERMDPAKRLDPDVETVLYRITQEAVNNVIKHADAKHVTVRLEQKQASITLYIKDDGKGFDEKKVPSDYPKSGIGLIGMQERAGIVGGNLSIQSRKGYGTEILVEIPVGIED